MDRADRGNAVVGVLMLLVVAIFGPATGSIYVDPYDPGFGARDFPVGVLVLMAVLAIALLARSLAGMLRAGEAFGGFGEVTDFVRYVVPMIAIGFVYVWLIGLFQYALPTALAAAASLAVFGNRGFARLVVAPIIATLVYYVLFFGVLGLHEQPGSILAFDSQAFFQPLRIFLGLL
ncbi:MAG: hypothetical protein WD270_09675 [Acetobacterales bacterium]